MMILSIFVLQLYWIIKLIIKIFLKGKEKKSCFFFLPELWVLLFCLLLLLLKVIPQVFFVESFLQLQKKKYTCYSTSSQAPIVKFVTKIYEEQSDPGEKGKDILKCNSNAVRLNCYSHWFPLWIHLLSGSNESVFNSDSLSILLTTIPTTFNYEWFFYAEIVLNICLGKTDKWGERFILIEP